MRLLADTHTFLWFADGNPLLSPYARTLLEDTGNEIFLSMASLWEMAIKVSIGKLEQLTGPQPLDAQVNALLEQLDILVLPIERSHVFAVVNLPLHHRDPFDRLLVAQSLHEGMPLISADAVLDPYGIQRLW